MTVDCETEADLQAAFQAAGISISSDQLRRWRDRGLMPPVKQIGLGRAAGSIIHYPVGTAQLAIEIGRLLAIKKDFDFVGWYLWMRGYDVAERYWKPLVNSAYVELKRLPAWMRLMEQRHGTDSHTLFDKAASWDFSNTVLSKGLSKLIPDERAAVFGFLADIVKGQFEPDLVADQSEQESNREMILKFIGQPKSSTVGGVLNSEVFSSGLEMYFKEISLVIREIPKKETSIEFSYYNNIAIEFYKILSIIEDIIPSYDKLSKSPIGRFIAVISQSPSLQSYALIVWGELRRDGRRLSDSNLNTSQP